MRSRVETVTALPKVSVIVPTFNIARYVRDCLASVQAQTLPDWECIVVDDGSTDGTPERVRAFDDRRIRLIIQPNGGVSAARNAGMASARGRYLVFLDGDDLLHRRALERLAQDLDARPDAVLAYGNVSLVFEDGRPYPQTALRRRSLPSGDVLKRVMEWDVFLPVGSSMVRSSCVREIGGFKAELRLGEDWEFCCRVAASGEFRFIGSDPEVSYVRVRNRSASRQLSHDWRNHLPTIEAVTSNPLLAARFRQSDWRRVCRLVMAAHLWEAGRMNFIARRYAEARRLMLKSFAHGITARRLALFAIAQASQLLGVSLASRLRFLDEDACR